MSYAKPITPTPPGAATPRTLLPCSNKPSFVQVPTTHFDRRHFISDWTCTTHIIQAASPRESPAAATSAHLSAKPLPAEATKAERQTAVDLKYAQIMERRNAIASGVKVAPDDTIMCHPNRNARDGVSQGGKRMITMYAGSYSYTDKIWDTTFRFIISMLERTSHVSNVTEIWALDAVNHGDSALLNDGKLGDVYEWSDHARDITNFIINYLPETPVECKETCLPLVSEQVSHQRRTNGFNSRTVVGLGHSFGGCTLMRAALELPRLFSGVILVDPVIYPSYGQRTEGVGKLTKGAIARRDQWPDVNAAKAGLLNSPFFRAWHADVFSDYMKYGVYESDGIIKLKCSGFQEGVTFAEHGRLPNEVWEMLPSFDERVPLRWIMDSTSALSTAGEEITQHTVWRRPKNSSNVRIRGAGHLIPQEAPERLAREVVDFIQQVVGVQGVKSRL